MSRSDMPALLLAGTNSGCGKTTVTLALLRALKRRGIAVQPFKYGPDYIDPEFHRLACGRDSINLDSFLQGEQGLVRAFSRFAGKAEAAVVEGVMGLFDGKDPCSMDGSSAECALLLDLPVLLVVNVSGIGGSIAPLVSGFVHWHPALKIAGVIADRAGSRRHHDLLSEALSHAKLPPLLGSLPANPRFAMPERHLGLTPAAENPLSTQDLDFLAEQLELHCDLERILDVCRIGRPAVPPETQRPAGRGSAALAVARDEAFHFYYRENLDMLEQCGVDLIFFSPIHDRTIPPGVSGIWIGGGFPEMFAEELSRNGSMRQSIRDFAEKGGLLYGECGGYLYLADSLKTLDGKIYPMTGLIPRSGVMNAKRTALGYRTLVCRAENGPFPKDSVFRGHEFHYSSIPETDDTLPPLWEGVDSRGGIASSASGAAMGNVCGSYAHLHFASNPQALSFFAEKLIRLRERGISS